MEENIMSDFKNKELEKAFGVCIDELITACSEFPWENKYAYAFWLAQTYYFVRHTTSFLGLAASRFGYKDRERHYNMLTHIQDELNHDRLAIDDIKNLDFKLEDFPELPETSAFYQSQYYYIEHEHPAALFGYSLCLEGLASKKGTELYEITKKHHGPKGTNFLKLHAIVDKDHFEHGLEHFKNISDAEAEVITKNLLQSTAIYKMILQKIKTVISQKKDLKKVS
jgi:hypothetical protein